MNDCFAGIRIADVEYGQASVWSSRQNARPENDARFADLERLVERTENDRAGVLCTGCCSRRNVVPGLIAPLTVRHPEKALRVQGLGFAGRIGIPIADAVIHRR